MQEQNTAVNVVDAVDRRPQLGGAHGVGREDDFGAVVATVPLAVCQVNLALSTQLPRQVEKP